MLEFQKIQNLHKYGRSYLRLSESKQKLEKILREMECKRVKRFFIFLRKKTGGVVVVPQKKCQLANLAAQIQKCFGILIQRTYKICTKILRGIMFLVM